MNSKTMNLLLLIGAAFGIVYFISTRKTQAAVARSGGASQGAWSNANSPATPLANIMRNFGVAQPRVDNTVSTLNAVSGVASALPAFATSLGSLFRRETWGGSARPETSMVNPTMNDPISNGYGGYSYDELVATGNDEPDWSAGQYGNADYEDYFSDYED